MLNDFALGEGRNSVDAENDQLGLLSGRSNGLLLNQKTIKNDREEINLDELNALLEEVDGKKFEDKFSKIVSSP